MKPTELLEVLRRQHEAIDMLLAQRAATDRNFFASKSPFWDTVVLGYNAICRLEAEIKGQPMFECPQCRRISYHPKDLEHGYCGYCHDFTGERPAEVKS